MSQQTAALAGLVVGAAPFPEETPPRAPRGRRRKWMATSALAGIPIVNDAHEIVGWTRTAPQVENGRLRHAEAERVLRGPIFCTQIALTRPQDIRRAGGPADWAGPWRCLARCPIENAQGLEQPSVAMVGQPPGAGPNHPAT